MTLKEYANDVNLSVAEVIKKCIDLGIEVKSGRRTSNNGMSVFAKKFNPKHTFVVGSGGVPIEDFLTADIETLLQE